MFSSLLIANRGEIACRIIGTARRLGIRTIAVYSDADANARHVRLADEAYRIGPAPARESYLVVENTLAAAKASGAEAIHPGYGFLSENADFAEACAAAKVVFVGPRPSSIRAMGSKSSAKTLMGKAGVPLTPGYHGDDQDPAHLAAEAKKIGFPVLIKASSGGGGKGMRRVDEAAQFPSALVSCQREARSSFGNDQVLIEKYVDRPRHIEVQVFGDTHGNYVYLFERDCSVQRRHQKVLEEAPAPGMTAERRAQMGATAILAAKAVDYVGAGTVELISDQSGTFYFMEMNTRLQVEHPVTEKITGTDLVEWQLRVASGERLPKTQSELSIKGHAIEARIYAENPDNDFLPSIGRLVHLRPPALSAHVRVDTGVEEGDAITASYDPMIAKLIVWGADRTEALAHMRTALGQYEIVGVTSNVAFLGRLVRTASFTEPQLDTGLIEREREALHADDTTVPEIVWQLAAIAEIAAKKSPAEDVGSPWLPRDGFRLGAHAPYVVDLRHGDTARELRATWLAADELAFGDARVRFEHRPDGTIRLWSEGRVVHASVVAHAQKLIVFVEGRRWELEHVVPAWAGASQAKPTGGLRSPMPGKVVAHIATVGAKVAAGAPLMVLEAMKMELTIFAPHAGTVVSFRYAVGEQVSEGVDLVDLKKD